MFSCVLPSAATAAAEPRRVPETWFFNKVQGSKLEFFIKKIFFSYFLIFLYLLSLQINVSEELILICQC